MFNKTLPGALVASVLLCGCGLSRDSKHRMVINKELEQVNDFVKQKNLEQYAELERRLNDPSTHYYTAKWIPVAQRMRVHGDSLEGYLRNMEAELRDNEDIKDEQRTALFSRLQAHRKDLINAFDSLPEKGQYIEKEISDLTHHSPFSNDSVVLLDGLAIDVGVLKKLEIDNRFFESRMLRFLVFQTVSRVDGFDKFDLLAGLSSSRVGAGEPIEVFSGIGAFSLRTNPRIVINGREVKVNDETGAASDTLKAANKPGRYAVPVRIEFTKPDGTRATVTKSLYYTVVSGR